MTKICPNCKTENIDTADFCQNCGTELPKFTYNVPPSGDEAAETKAKSGNWWSKQPTIVKILSVVGVCCVGLIVIVGLIAILFPDATTFNLDTGSVSDLTKTFSQSGLTFKYPDWQTTSDQGRMAVSSESNVQKLATLYSSNGLYLYVSMADLTPSGASVEFAKEATKTNIQQGSSAQLLSETKTTTNGVTVYELLYSIIDPTTNKENKALFVITGKDGQKAYYMQFVAENSVFDSEQTIIDNIISTIKVS